MDKKTADGLLQNWLELNRRLMDLDEADVFKLLQHEKAHKARVRIMLRLHNRLSKLRGARERAELAACAKA